ncbi:MAG: hypothetical protein A2126_03960 [Candidatus Woykebacteria bacterium GWB1_45_5]|uniref:Uncharacterized protein n=1 Tax=Candidatus Woykebacteria bacterium GWB1_45_5 TaxID=1802592 RepID=A0A1G1W3Q3_9BACT|nr:MAG: hypothetical protein A2126_03960 [Candidatus Woykebacteria bacterium GWB1_45_5]
MPETPNQPTDYIPPWKLPSEGSESQESEVAQQPTPKEQIPQNLSSTTTPSDKNIRKTSWITTLIVVLLTIGVVVGLLYLVSSEFYNFVAEGSVETIQKSMFLNVFTHSNSFKLLVGYLIISLIAVCLIFFRKTGSTSRVVLAILILLMILILGSTYPHVRQETNEFNTLLEDIKYPNVSRYEFDRFAAITQNDRDINFIVNDEIDNVLDYYKTNVASTNNFDPLSPSSVTEPYRQGNYRMASILFKNGTGVSLLSESGSRKTEVSAWKNY